VTRSEMLREVTDSLYAKVAATMPAGIESLDFPDDYVRPFYGDQLEAMAWWQATASDEAETEVEQSYRAVISAHEAIAHWYRETYAC
jgi:hypothetical protein